MMNSHFFQHKSYKGSTLIEVMMMLLVVSLALTTMFYTLSQSIQFARDTELRIKATTLAREGIEALINIRNTNWLRFSNNRVNCWNTLNYDTSCINSPSAATIENGNYVLYKEHGLWKLQKIDTQEPTPESILDNTAYVLGIDQSGWYTAKSPDAENFNIENTCQNRPPNNTNCITPFYRVITISDSSNTGMNITSEVFWRTQAPKKASLNIHLSNWKGHYAVE